MKIKLWLALFGTFLFSVPSAFAESPIQCNSDDGFGQITYSCEGVANGRIDTQSPFNVNEINFCFKKSPGDLTSSSSVYLTGYIYGTYVSNTQSKDEVFPGRDPNHGGRTYNNGDPFEQMLVIKADPFSISNNIYSLTEPSHTDGAYLYYQKYKSNTTYDINKNSGTYTLERSGWGVFWEMVVSFSFQCHVGPTVNKVVKWW